MISVGTLFAAAHSSEATAKTTPGGDVRHAPPASVGEHAGGQRGGQRAERDGADDEPLGGVRRSGTPS